MLSPIEREFRYLSHLYVAFNFMSKKLQYKMSGNVKEYHHLNSTVIWRNKTDIRPSYISYQRDYYQRNKEKIKLANNIIYKRKTGKI